MAASFFFYDLETSGINPRSSRVMQFAGQRTDLDLQPIGDPVNILIKLTPDTLPEPDAIMITGITPQQTLSDGVSEAEFVRFFNDQIALPQTTFLGYNSIRFDDEFMRYLLYRNFSDPYQWQWANHASKWDLLDVVRMTRALRPEGIEWPFTPEGKPTNRLELITKLNGLDHQHAHDALNDVLATIAVAQLIKIKQPDLFGYLYDHRSKQSVRELITSGQPFVYSSGRYLSDYLCTSMAIFLAQGTNPNDVVIYDLREDPTQFLAMDVEQLAKCWGRKKDSDLPQLPIKTVKLNHCPAVAPSGVLKDKTSQERIGISLQKVAKHRAILKANQQTFADKVLQVIALKDEQRAREQISLIKSEHNVDSRLYDELPEAADKPLLPAIRAAKPQQLDSYAAKLKDERLQQLLPLYKARNYPAHLNDKERQAWELFCKHQLFDGGQQSRVVSYFNRLQSLSQQASLTPEQNYLLEELQLYGQSILPADVAD